jgi:hypothetical protein
MSRRVRHLKPGDTIYLGSEGRYFDEGDWHMWKVIECVPIPDSYYWDLKMEALDNPSIVFHYAVSGDLGVTED